MVVGWIAGTRDRAPRPGICSLLYGLALGLACGPEPADTATASGGAPDPTSSAATTSSDPTTEDAIATSTTTTGVEPCEDTLGETAGLFNPTAKPPQCVEPQIEWDGRNGAHLDCQVDCSTLTMIHGEGPAAGIQATQISFGVDYGPCGKGLTLRRFRLGAVEIITDLECALDPWLGDHVGTAYFLDDPRFDEPPFEVNMTLDGYSGDWLSADPVDPPRLFGSFSGSLVGPFEAVHCGWLDSYVSNC